MYKNVDQVYGVEPVANSLKESFLTIFKTFKDIRKHKVVVILCFLTFVHRRGRYNIKMVVPYAQSAFDPKQFNTVILLAILVYVQVVAFPLL